MGLTLQFAIGDKIELIRAFEEFNEDFLDDLESQSHLVDFSLHIIPNDLNFLVNIASGLRNDTIFGLREHLDTSIFYFDEPTSGAYFVDPIINELFSTFEESDAFEITHKWFEKLRTEYKEDIEVTNDAILAVQQLISVCKKATKYKLDLVHIWYS
jgi:hypothetical protein